jgi:Asp/Glu/hydantoin racemase
MKTEGTVRQLNTSEENTFTHEYISTTDKKNNGILNNYFSSLFFCCVTDPKRSENNLNNSSYRSQLPNPQRKIRSTPLETLRRESLLSPSSSEVKTLVLDLDETLIHSEFDVIILFLTHLACRM